MDDARQKVMDFVMMKDLVREMRKDFLNQNLPVNQEDQRLIQKEIPDDQVILLGDHDNHMERNEEIIPDDQVIPLEDYDHLIEHIEKENANQKVIKGLMMEDLEDQLERERMEQQDLEKIIVERWKGDRLREEEERRKREREDQIRQVRPKRDGLFDIAVPPQFKFRPFPDNNGNDWNLEQEDAEEQRRILEAIQKEKQENQLNDEQNRLTKILMSQVDQNPIPTTNMEEVFEYLFEDQVQEAPQLKKLHKTGFGIHYIRWCFKNSGFDWNDPITNEPMNKIDYFKIHIWDNLNDLEKQEWLTRAFNKNNYIDDPNDQREVKEMIDRREQAIRDNQPRQVNERTGCYCGQCR